MKRLVLLFAALMCCALVPAGADPAPTATDFLKQSMSRYQALKSFGAHCTWDEQYGSLSGLPASPTDTRTFLYAAPNRFKVVSSQIGFVQTSVCDGVHLAEYTSVKSLPAQT
jgi:hypothetical protein